MSKWFYLSIGVVALVTAVSFAICPLEERPDTTPLHDAAEGAIWRESRN